MEEILALYEQLENKLRSVYSAQDLERLRAAFDYANAHHGTQLRKSGEPYITHPIAVAEIVADQGLDMDSVLAAMLHDLSLIHI